MNRSFLAPGLAAVLLVVASTGAFAAQKPVIVSVSSRTDSDYKRTKLPDGSFKPEFYAISNGGKVEGTTRDEAQESMDLTVIVKAVAEQLAQQNYHLAPDAKSAELLLVVQWGRTIPFNDVNYSSRVGQMGDAMNQMQNVMRSGGPQRSASSPEEAQAAQADNAARLEDQFRAADQLQDQVAAMQMENAVRDQRNASNAQLLGYMDAINDANGIQRFAGGGGNRYDDLRGDIEESRYYIIISAFDFRRLIDHKERKLQWVTRISIRVRGNRFDERVAEMVARAARYFGNDSGRLVREYEGTVELGETQVIGVVDDPPPPAPSTTPETPVPEATDQKQ